MPVVRFLSTALSSALGAIPPLSRHRSDESRDLFGSAKVLRNLGKYAAAAMAFSAVLAGCSSVVYKDTATQYVAASKSLVKFFEQSDSAFKSTNNLAKTAVIASDRACPVAQDRLFVRTDSPPSFTKYIESASFKEYVARSAATARSALAASCAAIEKSEAEKSSTSCYSAEEGYCLTNLERVIRLDPRERSDVSAFNDSLAAVEYDRSVSSSQLLGRTLAVITAYTDVLSKIVAEQAEDANADAKKLNDKIGELQTDYTKYTGNDISQAEAARIAVVNKRVTALGAVLNDVSSIANSARQISDMKAAVIKNKATVSAAIKELSPLADAEVLMNADLLDRSTMQIRKSMQRDFANASTDYERAQIWLDLRTKYPYSNANTAELTSDVDTIFKQLQKSHDDLVSLIEDPTNEQRQKLRDANFESFKSLVEDAVAAAASFK
jgi:hypothetical protein